MGIITNKQIYSTTQPPPPANELKFDSNTIFQLLPPTGHVIQPSSDWCKKNKKSKPNCKQKGEKSQITRCCSLTSNSLHFNTDRQDTNLCLYMVVLRNSRDLDKSPVCMSYPSQPWMSQYMIKVSHKNWIIKQGLKCCFWSSSHCWR